MLNVVPEYNEAQMRVLLMYIHIDGKSVTTNHYRVYLFMRKYLICLKPLLVRLIDIGEQLCTRTQDKMIKIAASEFMNVCKTF